MVRSTDLRGDTTLFIEL